jgi:hypothetical protein
MRRRALLALFTLGCHDGGSEPKDVSVPAVGRYAYSFAPIGRGELIHPQTGDLYITYASRDSLAGVWDVAEYLRPVVGGAWDGDAYVIEALSTFDSYAGTAFHRLTTAGARDLLRCEGRDSVPPIIGGPYFVPATCTLTWTGAATAPAVPSVAGHYALSGTMVRQSPPPNDSIYRTTGTLDFAQPNRQVGDFGGDAAVTLSDGGGSASGLPAATITPDGQVTFYVGPRTPTVYWKFTATFGASHFSGFQEWHRADGSVLTGTWDAMR